MENLNEGRFEKVKVKLNEVQFGEDQTTHIMCSYFKSNLVK